MSGTKAGGIKARESNYKNNGRDFYIKIGSKGGRHSHKGGFYANPDLAKKAGAKGGSISRRGEANKTRELLKANKELVKKMVAEGKSVKDISLATGIPTSALYKRIKNGDVRSYDEE